MYALRVNQASTRGYFLKQETKKYDALVFQRSIVQLDNLQLERKLYEDVFKSRSSWYEDEGHRIVVTIGKPIEKATEASSADIQLADIVDAQTGELSVFEYEE